MSNKTLCLKASFSLSYSFCSSLPILFNFYLKKEAHFLTEPRSARLKVTAEFWLCPRHELQIFFFLSLTPPSVFIEFVRM